MAGKDLNDNYTLSQPPIVPDYTRALNKHALTLKGKRIGVPRRVFLNNSIVDNDPYVDVAFEEALGVMRGLGAEVVDPADLPDADDIWEYRIRGTVFRVDFKVR